MIYFINIRLIDNIKFRFSTNDCSVKVAESLGLIKLNWMQLRWHLAIRLAGWEAIETADAPENP